MIESPEKPNDTIFRSRALVAHLPLSGRGPTSEQTNYYKQNGNAYTGKGLILGRRTCRNLQRLTNGSNNKHLLILYHLLTRRRVGRPRILEKPRKYYAPDGRGSGIDPTYPSQRNSNDIR